MIAFPGARSLGTEPPTILFIRTANGRHYILAMCATKYFFPPIHLEWKELKGPSYLSNPGCQEFPQAAPETPLPSE